MLGDYREFMQYHSPTFVDDPSPKQVSRYHSLIDQNDAPILAAAISSGADYLVSWDKKHFLKSGVKTIPGITIATPGEFLQKFREHIEQQR